MHPIGHLNLVLRLSFGEYVYPGFLRILVFFSSFSRKIHHPWPPTSRGFLLFADECSELCHGVCFCVHPVTMLYKRGELKEAHSQRTNRNSCKTDHIWDMIMVCTPNLVQRPYCTAQECKYLHKNLCNHCTTHQLKSLVSEKEAHSQHPKDQHAKRTKSLWSWYATPNLVQRPYCTAPGMKVSPQIVRSHCTTHQLKPLESEKEAHSQHPKDQHAKRT